MTLTSPDVQPPPPRVGNLVVSGTIWLAGAETLRHGLNFFVGLLAARLIDPTEFGVVGVVFVIRAMLEAMSRTGFERALIQRRDIDDAYLNVAFTLQAARGFLLAAVLVGAAPIASRIYGEPRLFGLITLMAGATALSGLKNIGVVQLERDLAFRELFLIRLLQFGYRLIVLLPAIFFLRNAWALVIGHLGYVASEVLVSYMKHPYRPWFRLDWPKFRELSSFGLWLTGMSVMTFVITQGDDVYVSLSLGLGALGLYQLAYQISNTPATEITHVVARVGFPAYSRLQAEPDELRSVFVGIMRGTMVLTGALSGFLFLLAPELPLLIGDKWEPTTGLVQLLVVSGLIRSFAALAGPLFQAMGRPDLDVRMNVPRLIALVVLLVPLTHWYGLHGACWTVLLAIAMCLPTWFWGVHKFTGLTPLRVLQENGLAVVSTGVLGVCLGVPLRLLPGSGGGRLVALVMGTVAWLGVLWLLGRFTRWDAIGEARQLMGRKRRAA